MVRIGYFARAHGVRGEALFRPYVEGSETIFGREALSIGRVAGEAHRYEVESCRPTAGGALVRLRGISDRDAADALKGFQVFVPREELPPLEEGEFYADDLLGMAVKRPSGETVGTVEKVADTGGVPILEVEGGGRSWQVPLADAFVQRIDIAARELIAVPADEEETTAE